MRPDLGVGRFVHIEGVERVRRLREVVQQGVFYTVRLEGRLHLILTLCLTFTLTGILLFSYPRFISMTTVSTNRSISSVLDMN